MLDGCVPLRGIRRADAVIVGGGLTGLMTAASLGEGGMRVIVLDAGEPGQGSTALCTGSVTLLAAPVYARILKAHGPDEAHQHVDTLRSLMAELPAWLTTPFRETESYVYAFLPRDLPALEEQHRLCTSLGLPVHIAPDAGGCPFPVELSLVLPGQWMVDVAPLIEGLVQRIRRQGGQVYGRSLVIETDEGRVCTREGCVAAPVMILACGKPPGLIHPGVFALLESRMMLQCRLTSQVPLHTCQQSVRPDGLSLRPIPGGALASFCAGRGGTRAVPERTALFHRILHGRLKDWEAGPLDFRQELWALDGLPVIGALPGYRGRVLCAAGYSGHGMLGAALAARVLTRRIMGSVLPEDRLYAPDRTLPRDLLRQSRQHLRWLRARAALHPQAPACTLCRCRLRYCAPAARWECPVCGSAFGMLGGLLNGPAVRDACISASQRPD